MDLQQIAQDLWPCWLMGIIMLVLVLNSEYKNHLRVSKEGMWKFAGWLAFLTAFRVVALLVGLTILKPIVAKFFDPDRLMNYIKHTVNFIPWQASLGVFWEDMCHTVPLVLASQLFEGKTWYKWLSGPMLWITMASFGGGHLYEGVWAVFVLSMYIPITMDLGKKYGFGTVILCHMIYDLTTLFTLKWISGVW